MPNMEKMKKNKSIIFTGIFFFCVGIIGCGWWWYRSTVIISTDDARVSGTIINVSSKISGRVSEVLVKEGDTITAGQVLVKIDKRDIVAKKNQAQSALTFATAKYDAVLAGSRPQEINQARFKREQAEAQVEETATNLKYAEKNSQRMDRLFADGAISASQKDDADTLSLTAEKKWLAARKAAQEAKERFDLLTIGSREEDIRAAKAQVEQAQAALDTACLEYEYTEITAPAAGVIALKNVNPGEVITVGQTLFSLVNDSDLWLNVRIEETKIGKVRIGQEAKYTIDGYPGQVFLGKISEVGMATNSTFALIPTENTSGNFTKTTQRIPIKITLPADTSDNIVFRPGMQALVDIYIK